MSKGCEDIRKRVPLFPAWMHGLDARIDAEGSIFGVQPPRRVFRNI
jgi:hypothetical protein